MTDSTRMQDKGSPRRCCKVTYSTPSISQGLYSGSLIWNQGQYQAWKGIILWCNSIHREESKNMFSLIKDLLKFLMSCRCLSFQSHSLSSWILIPCSLHNGKPDGTEPGPKDWGPKDVGLCLHGMRWEEGGREKSLKEESMGKLWGVRVKTGREGEIRWWKLPDRPEGRAPRHQFRSPTYSGVSWVPWVMVDNALRCPPKVGQWSKRQPWQRRGN